MRAPRLKNITTRSKSSGNALFNSDAAVNIGREFWPVQFVSTSAQPRKSMMSKGIPTISLQLGMRSWHLQTAAIESSFIEFVRGNSADFSLSLLRGSLRQEEL